MRDRPPPIGPVSRGKAHAVGAVAEIDRERSHLFTIGTDDADLTAAQENDRSFTGRPDGALPRRGDSDRGAGDRVECSEKVEGAARARPRHARDDDAPCEVGEARRPGHPDAAGDARCATEDRCLEFHGVAAIDGHAHHRSAIRVEDVIGSIGPPAWRQPDHTALRIEDGLAGIPLAIWQGNVRE